MYPTWEEHYFYRSVVLKNRRYEESLGAINTFLTIHPKNAEAIHNKATILSDLRQFQESLIYHQKAIELKPNEAQYYATAGIAAFDLKQFDLAEMYLKESIGMNPNVSISHSYLGLMYILQQRLAEARKPP